MNAIELRTWRARLGLTQADAADRLGISKDTLSNYEGGRRLRGDDEEVPKAIAYACHWLSLIEAVNRVSPEIATSEARLNARELQYSLSLPIWFTGPDRKGREFETNHDLQQHLGAIPRDEPALLRMLFPQKSLTALRASMHIPPRTAI